MKKIVIYGAGRNGIFLKKLLENKEICMGGELQPVYFCDTYKRDRSYVAGLEIISPERLKKIEANIDGILISNIIYVDEIQRKLVDLNISIEVYVVPDYVFLFGWNKKDMPFMIRVDLSKPRMPYLEIRIVEHCNLKCKGCSVLANISEPGFVDMEKLESDFKKLKEIFWGIKFLKLFGGEPLLHPDLKKIIGLSRFYFPDSVLVVHSNGLLIPEMDGSLFQVMKKECVKFEFTQYPPTGVKKRFIQRILDKNGVEYQFREPLYEFRKMINLDGNYDKNEIYKNCCKCINLINGTLSCGMGWGIKGLEEKYNVEICEDKFLHCVDIYNTDLNGWQINELLDSPYNLCSYCSFMDYMDIPDEQIMKWECGKPYKLSDWTYSSKENRVESAEK